MQEFSNMHGSQRLTYSESLAPQSGAGDELWPSCDIGAQSRKLEYTSCPYWLCVQNFELRASRNLYGLPSVPCPGIQEFQVAYFSTGNLKLKSLFKKLSTNSSLIWYFILAPRVLLTEFHVAAKHLWITNIERQYLLVHEASNGRFQHFFEPAIFTSPNTVLFAGDVKSKIVLRNWALIF